MDRHDAIVVGVGGMGSAATYHLARRGLDVLGLERFDVPHTKGSSHGGSRIIRRAYFEHPSYVPLVRRAYDRWAELAEESGRDLLQITGCISAGPPDGDVFAGARRSCAEHDLDHEVLSSTELAERFPAYDLPEDYEAVYEEGGGFLRPEECMLAHVEGAIERGAEIRARERVVAWEADDDGVRVETDKGEYAADGLVLAAGAWAADLLPELGGNAVPERQVVGWFQPERPERFSPEEFPVFVIDSGDTEHYGFPVADRPGFKFGQHHFRREDVDPDDFEREPTRADEDLLRDALADYFPDGTGPTLRLETCLYTNTPDTRFVVDTHPDHENVAVAAGFSGHGFKFSALVGEVLADLAVEGETDHDISPFEMDRF